MHLIHFVRISLVLIVVLYYSVLGNLTGKDLFSSSQQLLATKIRAKKGGNTTLKPKGSKRTQIRHYKITPPSPTVLKPILRIQKVVNLNC